MSKYKKWLQNYAKWLQNYAQETAGQRVCRTCGATVSEPSNLDDFLEEVFMGGGHDANGDYFCSQACRTKGESQ